MKNKKVQITNKKMATTKTAREFVDAYDSELICQEQLNNYRDFFQYLLSNDIDQELAEEVIDADETTAQQKEPYTPSLA